MEEWNKGMVALGCGGETVPSFPRPLYFYSGILFTDKKNFPLKYNHFVWPLLKKTFLFIYSLFFPLPLKNG